MTDPSFPNASPASGAASVAGAGAVALGRFERYEDAQALVDRLSDAGFPVQHVRIVGTGIHSVEQVTGRMTIGRAALAGAGTGAWFGLLIGLVLGLFVIGVAWVSVLIGSLIIGALWGAVFGAVAHWATRGRRDFASVRALAAREYTVEVDAPYAADASRIAASV